jgi:hypothetical protein
MSPTRQLRRDLVRVEGSASAAGGGITSRVAAAVAGALLAAGSAQTRFGVFDAGMASSKDPKYVVLPQRERMAARHGQAHAVTR